MSVRVFNYECTCVYVRSEKEKTAYGQVIEKGLVHRLSSGSKRAILSRIDVPNFDSTNIPHSLILFDDAINILKNKRHSKLCDLLFQNRQPRFTIFICLQDMYGIPAQLKRNADSIWIFAGFTDATVFNHTCKQLGSPIPPEQLWYIYKSLQSREIMIFDYSGETAVRFLNAFGNEINV